MKLLLYIPFVLLLMSCTQNTLKNSWSTIDGAPPDEVVLMSVFDKCDLKRKMKTVDSLYRMAERNRVFSSTAELHKEERSQKYITKANLIYEEAVDCMFKSGFVSMPN